MTTPMVKKRSAWFVLNRGVTVGQVKNGSDVRSANAGRTRSALAQTELYTYATTVSRVIRTLLTSGVSGQEEVKWVLF